MNSAEIKLELFRKIDSLDNNELKVVYHKLIQVLNDYKVYQLSETEEKAINEAFLDIQNEDLYSSNQIVAEAKEKYPNLNFK